MPRMSRATTELHHRQLTEAAARLVRERGAERVSVPEVMASVGMTHGGFYRHFASKDELIGAACGAAMEQRLAEMETVSRDTFVTGYLSSAHRDSPQAGCAVAALAGDAARATPDSPLRRSFGDGLRQTADKLGELDGSTDRGRNLADLAALVGAVTLARACQGDELSDEILAAVRERLLG